MVHCLDIMHEQQTLKIQQKKGSETGECAEPTFREKKEVCQLPFGGIAPQAGQRNSKLIIQNGNWTTLSQTNKAEYAYSER
jgi:hypothetical protein